MKSKTPEERLTEAYLAAAEAGALERPCPVERVKLAEDAQTIEWVESMRLDQLIELVSERVTHMSLDWADGCCRAEIRSGHRRWIGRGPNSQVALARAMMLHDETVREEGGHVWEIQ